MARPVHTSCPSVGCDICQGDWPCARLVARSSTAKPDYGFDDLMVTAAFRYCLGRQTYIVRECAEWLIRIWPALSERAKIIIQRELEQAFYDDQEGRGYLPLGQDCDRKEWEKVRGLWANHPPPQPAHSSAA